MCVQVKSLQLYLTLYDVTDYSSPELCPWDSPGKNTGVVCHALLQRIFLTQGSKTYLLKSPALAGGFFATSAKVRSWAVRQRNSTTGELPKGELGLGREGTLPDCTVNRETFFALKPVFECCFPLL